MDPHATQDSQAAGTIAAAAAAASCGTAYLALRLLSTSLLCTSCTSAPAWACLLGSCAG